MHYKSGAILFVIATLTCHLPSSFPSKKLPTARSLVILAFDGGKAKQSPMLCRFGRNEVLL